ncbi:MAG: hypothetical protein IJ794_19630 [Lachnospiraceae bacterium]|nr:hypothetical protein [Lachnospiraceae bacterium]
MQKDKKTEREQDKIAMILNILIVIFTVIGLLIMLFRNADNGLLLSKGFHNLKYYTVLSNLFCGIVAVGWLVGLRIPRGKLMAAAAVALTFFQIAAFFGPLYGYGKLYQGSNFFFHLIVPVLAMAEYVVTDQGEVRLRDTVIAAVPTVVYGCLYLVNIGINGVGEWPDSNDWYGFLNWGLPVGIGIFAGIVAVNVVLACVLRKLNLLLHKRSRK